MFLLSTNVPFRDRASVYRAGSSEPTGFLFFLSFRNFSVILMQFWFWTRWFYIQILLILFMNQVSKISGSVHVVHLVVPFKFQASFNTMIAENYDSLYYHAHVTSASYSFAVVEIRKLSFCVSLQNYDYILIFIVIFIWFYAFCLV